MHGEPDPNKFDFDNLDPELYTQYFGFTCSSPFNTFSRSYRKVNITSAHEMRGKRLDYIFYRHTPQLTCVHSSVVLTNTIEHTDLSYSDHFGVMSTFQLSAHHEADTSSTLLTHDPSYTHLSPSVLDEILEELKKEQDYCKNSSNRLLVLCCLFVISQLILYLLTIVLPTTLRDHGALPVALVTALGGALMNIASVLIPICLIVGFVFGHTEEKAFRQFVDEIDAFRHQALNANCVLTE
ncbi:hypothetical protein A0J61_06284 [Choanephora cucurbitarum]|uniref:Inositol phosphosphingolipids phospholipase C n=1 Tax=Choanephora cucurbitarum TaxID=101091 RepID=A0A1C7NAD8_9FUNG|nr:hypothetical protein A0J61_06284 [Choanephora cucurbitarum]